MNSWNIVLRDGCVYKPAADQASIPWIQVYYPHGEGKRIWFVYAVDSSNKTVALHREGTWVDDWTNGNTEGD